MCIGLWCNEIGWKKETAIYSPCSKLKISPRQTRPLLHLHWQQKYLQESHTYAELNEGNTFGVQLVLPLSLKAPLWPRCYIGNSVLPLTVYGECAKYHTNEPTEEDVRVMAVYNCQVGCFLRCFSCSLRAHVVMKTIMLQVCELLWTRKIMSYLKMRVSRWSG